MKKLISRCLGLVLMLGMLLGMPMVVNAVGNIPQQVIKQVEDLAKKHSDNQDAQTFVKTIKKLLDDTHFNDMSYQHEHFTAGEKDVMSSPLYKNHGFNPLFPNFFRGFINLVLQNFEQHGFGNAFILDIMMSMKIGM